MEENAIEFLTDARIAYMTFTDKRFIDKVVKLAAKNKRVQIIEQGSNYVYAKMPVSFLNLSEKTRNSKAKS